MSDGFEIIEVGNKQGILHVKMNEADWKVYNSAMDHAFDIIGQSDERFDLILQVPPDPPPGLPLKHFRRTGGKWSKHPNLKTFFVIQLGAISRDFMAKIAQIVLSVVLPANSGKYYFVDTLDQAIARIEELRQEDSTSQY